MNTKFSPTFYWIQFYILRAKSSYIERVQVLY